MLLFAALSPLFAAAQIDARTRREIGAVLTRIVEREVPGAGVRIQGAQASKKRVQLYASTGLSYYPFREENTRAIYDSVRALLPRSYARARIEIYTDRREIASLIPMACRTGLPKRRKDRPVPFVNRAAAPWVTPLSRATVPTRGLAGRHLALWQSHGRYFDQTQNRWRWQRTRQWQTCEDLFTWSYVVPYLVPMLENAGACVLLPRERDVQRHEVLCDNDAAAGYREESGAQAWTPGGPGFAQRQPVYRTGENPFRHGTTRQCRTVSGTAAESRAVWKASIPERGEYAVYVSYESTPQSAEDASYAVRHLGGESRFAVNQTMGGGTWVYLGTFLLDAGEQEIVTLSNRSRTDRRTVSADAVKIGGGYGNIARTVCDSLRRPGTAYAEETSGYPRYCEGARYWLQWAGFDESVYTPKEHADDYKDDYMSRAHWVNALMGGSERLPDSAGLRIPVDLALAFHSDAGVRDGDEVIGTLAICYTRDNDGRFAGGADRYRSRDLTDLVQTQIVEDIRRTWEPAWRRRGLWNRAYYEARVPGAPTMLLELLSHQNFADMRYGHDPRFKFLVSRAVYKGILRFVASQYGTPYVVQPLPVEALAARLDDGGGVVLTWSPVADSLERTAAPAGYVVYTRIDDGGFDAGRHVDVPRFETRQEPGRIYSYRVTAVNAGGESFPSETVAACALPDAKGRVLVVNGFDRIGAPVSAACDSLAGFLSGYDSGVPDRREVSFVGPQRIFDRSQARNTDESCALGACDHDHEAELIGGNTFDYPYLYGRSIVRAGYSFCSASRTAVEREEVPLGEFDAVDLILGKQRTATLGRNRSEPDFELFPAALRAPVRRYMAAGGAIFVSGCYVATDLWTGAGASPEGQAFAREVLHYGFDGGQAGSLRGEPAELLDNASAAGTPTVRGRVRVVAPSPFSRGDYRYVDDFRPDRYRVESPDALQPVGADAVAVMRYVDGGRPAAVACAPARTFVLGFPFEALDTEAERDRLMRDVLAFLRVGNNSDR